MSKSEKVKHAVIPAAGRGTRMAPVTRGHPKELLPLGNKPLIDWCLEELIDTTIESVLIVINEKKEQLRDYVLKGGGDPPFHERFDCRFLYQDPPIGVADAIAQAESLIGKAPFHVLLPDNLYVGDIAPVPLLQEAFSQHGRDVVALTTVEKDQASTFGNCGQVEVDWMKEGVCRVTGVADKGEGPFDMGGADRRPRVFPRYLLTSAFFKIFREMEESWSGEKDDVPILQAMAREGKLIGRVLPGRGLDLGHERGYLAGRQYLLNEGG